MNPNVFDEFIVWHKEHMSVLFNLGYYADPKIQDTKVCKNSCPAETFQRLVQACRNTKSIHIFLEEIKYCIIVSLGQYLRKVAMKNS